jgi:hypothetical protein
MFFWGKSHAGSRHTLVYGLFLRPPTKMYTDILYLTCFALSVAKAFTEHWESNTLWGFLCTKNGIIDKVSVVYYRQTLVTANEHTAQTDI